MFAAQSAGAGDHQKDRGPGSTREERSHNNEGGMTMTRLRVLVAVFLLLAVVGAASVAPLCSSLMLAAMTVSPHSETSGAR